MSCLHRVSNCYLRGHMACRHTSTFLCPESLVGSNVRNNFVRRALRGRDQPTAPLSYSPCTQTFALSYQAPGLPRQRTVNLVAATAVSLVSDRE